MNAEYIIIQAGGKGTRLGALTKNKPKALVPIDNKPMIFHLFDKFPNKKFIVIGDYLFDVLDKYIKTFCDKKTIVIKTGKPGTCSGINEALKLIPKNKSFMLCWSDLILDDECFDSDFSKNNYVGISKNFECRWSYKNEEFCETPSSNQGVAGLFFFKNKKQIEFVPESGEFVRWLQESGLEFKELSLNNTYEKGVLSAIKSTANLRCRSFNKMTIKGGKIIKIPISAQGQTIHSDELNWYKEAKKLGFEGIPKIFSYKPLTMEHIKGKNIYEYKDIDISQKKKKLKKIIYTLKDLHTCAKAETDVFSVIDAYYSKTVKRLEKVRNLIPFANERKIKINGKFYDNIFFSLSEFSSIVNRYLIDCSFSFMHGDCTFSNMMTDDEGKIKLIDPRGYFGHTKLYGDVNYDFAKLYYSLKGNYDCFNNKDFELTVTNEEVFLKIGSNGWEELEQYFFEETHCDIIKIKLIHSIIWLSLTTYAWEDYDAVCGAFYNGLIYYNEVLELIK